MERVPNGSGIHTSCYSISNIGMADRRAPSASLPESFELAKLLHAPSLKNKHMQTHYPGTIAKLQPVNKRPPPPVKSRGAPPPLFQDEFPEQARRIAQESRQAYAARKANSVKSRRCQISF